MHLYGAPLLIKDEEDFASMTSLNIGRDYEYKDVYYKIYRPRELFVTLHTYGYTITRT